MLWSGKWYLYVNYTVLYTFFFIFKHTYLFSVLFLHLIMLLFGFAFTVKKYIYDPSSNISHLFCKSPFQSFQNILLSVWFACKCLCVCMLSCFSCVQLFMNLWTVGCQASLSMGLSRPQYWSGLPCLPQGIFPQGIFPTQG